MATTTEWISLQGATRNIKSGVATIDINETATLPIPCGGRGVVRLQFPAAFTGTTVTFTAQALPTTTKDGTTYTVPFVPVVDKDGATISYTIGTSRIVTVPELSGVFAFTIVSGSSEAAARQIFVEMVGENPVAVATEIDVNPEAATSGGATPYSYISVGTSDDATIVKASAGQIYSIMATNVNAAVRYLKVYNKATAPTTSDTPVLRLAIPGSATGAGFVFPTAVGLAFSAGISFRLVTGVADNNGTDVAADEILVNIGYK